MNERFPSKLKIDWKKYSPIENIAFMVYNLMGLLSIFNHTKNCKLISSSKVKETVVDAYILFQLFFCFIFLFWFRIRLFVVVISIYFLYEVLYSSFRDLLSYFQLPNNRINGRRWILISFSNILLIIVTFGVIIKYTSMHFSPNICNPLTAFYMSALTFTTLGFGDIEPIDSIGKLIVCFELFYFLFFLALKLPMALSVIKYRDDSSV